MSASSGRPSSSSCRRGDHGIDLAARRFGGDPAVGQGAPQQLHGGAGGGLGVRGGEPGLGDLDGGQPEARVDEVDRRSTQRHLITEPYRQLPARHDVATTRDHRPSPHGKGRRWQGTLATEIGEERVPQVVGHEGAYRPG